MIKLLRLPVLRYLLLFVLLCGISLTLPLSAKAAEESGSVGIQGIIPSPPPTTGASISVPGSGQAFTQLPITVSGICPNDLLVKIFKNNVFAGSTQCENGSFSILIDLFSGKNDLIARVFDVMDQPGPDSATVSVTYNDNSTGTRDADRVLLSTNYAKRGANPGETLSWPILLSGGFGPYAISVDWGDGENSAQPVAFPGEFIVEHQYKNAGIYRVIVKAVDSQGSTAYLQLVALANGPLSQTSTSDDADDGDSNAATRTVILWQPAAIIVPFLLSTFWLGKKYEVRHIKRAVQEGRRPF